MKNNIVVNYNHWIDNAPDDIKEIIRSYSKSERDEAFYKELEFGTAGIRGKIGYGTNLLNIYNVSKIALGYGKWIKSKYPKDFGKGIVVVHDNRKMRKEFSLAVAETISNLGIPVYLYDKNKLQSTPFLSYTILHNDFVGGINITASHNPADYNGLKIYYQNGSQLSSKMSLEVKNEFEKIENVFEINRSDENIKFLGKKYEDDYVEALVKGVPLIQGKINRKDLIITYSAQCGTGTAITKKVSKEMKVSMKYVEDQCIPDENFAATIDPNPQNKNSFVELEKVGNENGSELLITTDPDADRVGVAVKSNNEWIILSGNQLPVIQIYWMFTKLKEMNKLPNNGFIVKSVVTSNLGERIAKSFGVKTFNSLTGFKWIIAEMLKQKSKNMVPLFMWEESNGSVIKDFTHDKDSFQTIIQVIEMSYDLKQQGLTLLDLFEEIESIYGKYYMNQDQLFFRGIDGSDKMMDLINKFRKYEVGDKISGLEITKIIDFKKGYKSFAKEDVLFIYLEKTSFICLRPSGTEPMIRIYYDLYNFDLKEINALKRFVKKIK